MVACVSGRPCVVPARGTRYENRMPTTTLFSPFRGTGTVKSV